jgi:glycosyltransferase involved in cell wall biosynthesis
MSVIDYVDKVLIYDTGSTDKTLKIINKINNSKITLKEINSSKFEEDKIRQQMLDETDSDWFIVLDGDEIWWQKSIQALLAEINKNKNIDSIVVPTVNVVGDMFHVQEKNAGKYHLAGRIGHLNLRAINRKMEGLHGEGKHGVFRWADSMDVSIENRNENRIKYLDAPYLHVTHLKRTTDVIDNDIVYKRTFKLKYEIGKRLPLDYYYPEVFFKDRPKIVLTPWKVRSNKYLSLALFQRPFKLLKRKFNLNKKYGY